jgi:hypothetical protein
LLTPRPKRAHQGWRYLEDKDDLPPADSTGVAELPPRLFGKLAGLGLI